jgi:DnaK suppressor protein
MINLEEIKNKLLKEKEEVLLMLETLKKEEEGVLKEDVYETSDLANKYEAREDLHLQIEALEKRLEVLERALTKINEGTYGKCEKCGGVIEEGRISLDPATIYCRKCAEKF